MRPRRRRRQRRQHAPRGQWRERLAHLLSIPRARRRLRRRGDGRLLLGLVRLRLPLLRRVRLRSQVGSTRDVQSPNRHRILELLDRRGQPGQGHLGALDGRGGGRGLRRRRRRRALPAALSPSAAVGGVTGSVYHGGRRRRGALFLFSERKRNGKPNYRWISVISFYARK